MNVSPFRLAAILSLSSLSSAGLAEASPITLSFAGQIDRPPDSRIGALAGVMEGDSFNGTFKVDLDQARLTLVGNDVQLAGAILDDSLQLQVGNLTLTAADATNTLFVRDSSDDDFLLFAFQFGTAAGSPDELLQVEFLFENFVA